MMTYLSFEAMKDSMRKSIICRSALNPQFGVLRVRFKSEKGNFINKDGLASTFVIFVASISPKKFS